MKWIEEVRDALELAQMDYIYKGDDKINPALKYTWEGTAGLMFTRIEKALAAIPDEDPMVKLLKWLRMRLQASSEAAENALGKRDIVWTKDIPKSLKLLAEYGLRQEDCRLLIEIIGYVEMLGYKLEDDS